MYGSDKYMGDHWTKSLRSRGLHLKAKPSGTAWGPEATPDLAGLLLFCEKT